MFLKSVCLSVAVNSLPTVVLVRSSREKSQTVRIDSYSTHNVIHHITMIRDVANYHQRCFGQFHDVMLHLATVHRLSKDKDNTHFHHKFQWVASQSSFQYRRQPAPINNKIFVIATKM